MEERRRGLDIWKIAGYTLNIHRVIINQTSQTGLRATHKGGVQSHYGTGKNREAGKGRGASRQKLKLMQVIIRTTRRSLRASSASLFLHEGAPCVHDKDVFATKTESADHSPLNDFLLCVEAHGYSCIHITRAANSSPAVAL